VAALQHAAMARPKRMASLANTSPGVSVRKMCRNFS